MENKKNYGPTLKKEYKPRFLKPDELSVEQLTDPDYSKKQLRKLNGGRLENTCSKCHHCR